MARLADILLAFQKQVMTLCGLPETKVAIVARDPQTIPNLEGERDVLIRLRNFTADQAHTGRHDMRERRLLDITLRYRLATDRVGSDISFLTKESVGFLEFERAIKNAVQLFHPADVNRPSSDPDFLMVQPMRILSGDGPSKDKRSADNLTWGSETISIELIFDEDLDQNTI